MLKYWNYGDGSQSWLSLTVNYGDGGQSWLSLIVNFYNCA